MNVNCWPDGVARTLVYPHDVSALRSCVLGLAVRGLLTNRAASVSGDSDTQSALTYPAPTAWRRTNLGKIIKLVSGQHLLPAEYNTDPNGGGIPYVTGPSNFERSGLIIDRYALVRKAVATEGQLLLTVKGSGVGSTAWCDQPHVAISRQLMALEATGCTPGFLELLVREMASYIKERARSLIPGISRDDVLGFMVAVPAEDEQDEIVAKVREVTALCDELEAFQTKRDNMCDRLRSASLARLTAPTETAGRVAEKDVTFFLSHSSRMVTRVEHVADLRRAIVDLAVAGRFHHSPPDGTGATVHDPKAWPLVRLADVCVKVTDGDHQPPPKAEAGVPFLVIGNVRKGYVDLTDCRFVPEHYYERLDEWHKPTRGDVLYTLVGSFGIPVPVSTADRFCVQRHIGILRPGGTVDQHYLVLALRSSRSFAQASECATGIAQKTVPLGGLRRLTLPVPPIEEQRNIVAKVDELMAVCDELERSLEAREAGRTRALEAVLHGVLEEAGAPLPVLLEAAG